MVSASIDVKTEFVEYIQDLQNRICKALENLDAQATFEEDIWQRPEGGGGKTRIIRNGRIFEKGGVNTSIVHGKLPPEMQRQFNTPHEQFFACGISLVLHPHNPFVPTTHANFRYFELKNTEGVTVDSWFGGGIDLTPYYMDVEDIVHFHKTLKNACDSVELGLYESYKKQCDDYFYIKHRQEMRGVGGIFYDYMRPNEVLSVEQLLDLAQNNGNAFLESYLPIVSKNFEKSYTKENKVWQEIRRGRYAEFNLVYDRGTLFGLKTGGRIESILMSLPTTVRWEYDFKPKEGSAEALMVEHLQPVDWVNYSISFSKEKKI
jgi:coproporphyrinogen III oxidase